MHLEVLVEDTSGKVALDALLPKMLPADKHTFKTIAYKGIGRVPKGLTTRADPSKRMLLDNLPRLLRGYGKSFPNYPMAVIVVMDLDRRPDCIAFKAELATLLNACQPRPNAYFRIAIEEMEAWFFGDEPALLAAYPKAKRNILAKYQQDSICGTWERLADAIYPGGSAALEKQGWPAPGFAKCDWAGNIAPRMNIAANRSPSFRALHDLIQRVVTIS